MRTKNTALVFAAAAGLMFCGSASALPIDVGVKNAASAASTMQQTQYYERHTRHRVIKCYRELVIGPYVCHSYYRW